MRETRGPGRVIVEGVVYYAPWKPRPGDNAIEAPRARSPLLRVVPRPLTARAAFALDMWAAREAYLSGAIEAETMDRAMSAALAHAGATIRP